QADTQTATLEPSPTRRPAATSTSRPALTAEATTASTSTADLYGIPIVLIPAGSFQMGGDADIAYAVCQKYYSNCNRDNYVDEEPIHTVYLDAFYIDVYEVTNALYANFLNEMGNQSEGGVTWLDAGASDARIHQVGGNWQADDGYADHPAVEVSWYGAQAVCEWRGGRLPTEAEWEYAARGGLDGKLYPWGDELGSNLANFCDVNCEYDHANANYDDGYSRTAPVGSYLPNGYGLFDMAGNVWEWVLDWYSPYTSDSATNPTGPELGDSRALRGGGWSSSGDYLRVSSRDWNSPDDTDDRIGFRCARSP
ncbi:MAG: formylglycine-generating enzyme family protein, partial [Anaerolineales bacterium]|nr:formylglycine-generating enzyme family protein [Anaerolineales bacterium]